MNTKVIHYCWFGKNHLPDSVKMCIASWQKFCPAFDIVEWNEDNFDFSDCDFAVSAYDAKKWAFVSDYARSKILLQNTGLFLDTDVEIIKSIDEICISPFIGFESELLINPGLVMYTNQKNFWLFNAAVKKYREISFDINDLYSYTSPQIYTEILCNHGLRKNGSRQTIDGLEIYPSEYFNPVGNLYGGTTHITPNTYSIHHFDGSWFEGDDHVLFEMRKRYGIKKGNVLYAIRHPLKAIKRISHNKK